MQERASEKRGEQYLLIKSPPASGKSRALMFIALDKLANQGLKQAIIVVPERSIGASFHDEPLSRYGFWADWKVAPKWNLCDAPGADNGEGQCARRVSSPASTRRSSARTRRSASRSRNSIDEAVKRIQDNTIVDYRYDVDSASLKLRNQKAS
jgi:hypothetical protein